MAFRDLEFRKKIILNSMFATTLALVMACATILVFDYFKIKEASLDILTTQADILGTNSTAALTFEDPSACEDTLAGLRAERNVSAARVYGKDGAPFATYVRSGFDGEIPAGASEEGYRFEDGHLYLYRPVVFDGEQIGTIYLDYEMEGMVARLFREASIMSGVMLASLLLASLLGARLQGMLTGPVLELVATAKQVSENQDYSARATKYSEDELGTLTDAFNDMLGQIQQRDRALQASREKLTSQAEALKRAHDEMEARVEQRTAELAFANAELKTEVVERKRAEEENAILARFPGENPSPVIRADRDGTILYANARSELLLGNWGWKVGKPVPDSWRETIREVLSSGENREVEVQCGDLIFSLMVTPIVEGGYVNFYGRDVTERKRAEDAVRQSEAQTRAVIESAADGIIAIDEKGAVESFNSAACNIFGYVSEEVIGRNIRMLMPPGESEAHNGHLARYVGGGERRIIGMRREVDGIRKDGSIFPMEIHISEVEFGDRRVFTGIVRDISERKEAEEAIERLRTQNQLILDAAGEGIYGLDLNGHTTFANPAAARMIGWELEDLIGKSQHAVLHHTRPDGSPYPREECPIYAAFKDGEVHHVDDEVFWRKDGTSFPVEYVSTPIRKDGELIGASVTFRDITERKRWEGELKEYASQLEANNKDLEAANMEAQTASRTKSEFLANMSHELRTPMNGIIGMCELALGTELNLEQQDYLQTVLSSAESLLSLLNDILDLSKIEAGKLRLEETEFDLVASVESVADVLAHRAAEKGIELIFSVAPTTPRWVRSDPHRLRQILVNLAGNAVKFTEKGEVVVEVQACHEAGDQVSVLFAVTDTGPGIPKDRHEAIFETFTQADGTTTRKYGGTGLGLAISKQLVNMFGGTICVESEPGRGSKFSFKVPLRKAGGDDRSRGAEAQALPEDQACLNDKRILVVDDNATNRRVMERTLSSWGCCVEVASSGSEGLQLLSDAHSCGRAFELLLLDIQMPGMDGLEVERRVRDDPAYGGPKVVFASSVGSRSDMDEEHRSRCAAHLTKPIKQSALKATVIRVLSGEETLLTTQGDGDPRDAASFSDRRRFAVRVLLVEDNPVNRKVARGILGKCGCDVTEAENGRIAVDVLEKMSFDLVFMDVQMPELDGLEATQLIRSDLGLVDLPIVAMTAHAMKGDRERCIEAGMNDYLTKPIRIETIKAMVGRWCSADRGSVDPDVVRSEEAGPEDDKDRNMNSPIDLQKALNHMAGDRELVMAVLETFVGMIPSMLADVQAAVSAGGGSALKDAAHNLKGAAANICAEPVRQVAVELEELAKADDLGCMAPAVKVLESRLAELKEAVDRLGDE